ncbi:MAG: site-2 protease family protein, partial [Anaerolineales bacterium]
PNRVKVLGIASGSPAEQAGLKTGDIILQVQGQKVDSVDKLHDFIYQRLGEPTTLVYERNGASFSTTLTPRNPPPPDQGAIGILMGVDTKPTTVFKAIPRGVQASFNYVVMLFSLPKMILSKQISPEMARPVGYKGMYDIYQQVQDPFSFFTMITMSLGVLNLFPIPALDGGRLLFTSIEIVTRRRLPPKYENAIHMVGFVLLLALLVYINIMDFVSPAKLPF